MSALETKNKGKKRLVALFIKCAFFVLPIIFVPVVVLAAGSYGGDYFHQYKKSFLDYSYFIEPHLTNTGAFTYQVPLSIPPGRNGTEPDLALTYSSQSKDNLSPFGYGWSTNINYIERIPRKGVESLYSEDFYYSTLDGELKASSTEAGTEDWGSLVDNGGFRKYEFINNEYWKVTDKTGKIFTFGATTDSRLNNSASTTSTFKWMIDDVRDTNGNYVSYDYFKDGNQIYPYTITYTGNDTTDGPFEIEFLRESRSDVATTTFAGFSIVSNYRIYEIQAKINSSWVKKYALGYTTGDNTVRSMLSLVTETGRDDNGTSISLPSTSFSYTINTNSASTTFSEDTNYSHPQGYLTGEGYDTGVRLADVNADGLADFLWGQDGAPEHNTVYINDGDGTGWSEDSNYSLPVTFTTSANADKGVRLADVNGDSYIDILHSTNSTSTVYINDGDGTGWTADYNYESLPQSFIDGGNKIKGLRLADVNGDGLADLIEANSATTSVYINDGDGTGWTVNYDYSVPVWFINADAVDQGVRLADVNGDGLVDILEGSLSTTTVYINDGDGTGWTNNPDYVLPQAFTGSDGADRGVRLADINGDGLIDIVYANNISPGYSIVYLNNGDGTGWTEDNNYLLPSEFIGSDGSDNGIRLVDVDGDGLVDFSLSSSSLSKVFISDSEKVDLLSEITINTGGTTNVFYKQSSEYLTSTSKVNNPDLPINISTPEMVVTDDGFGNIGTTTYSYAGGEFFYNDPFDKKFAGFASTTKTDAVGNVTYSYFHQGNSSLTSIGEYSDDFSKIGRTFRVEEYDDSNNLFRKAINKWENIALSNSRDFVKQTRAVNFDYDGDADHRDTAIEYSYDDENGNLSEQVEYGEVTGSDDGTFVDSGSDKRTTSYAYATNSASHILGLPSTETIKNNGGTTVAEKKFYYDSLSHGNVTTGNLTKEESLVSGSTYIDIENTYDGTYGLVTQTKDPRDKATTLVYDGYSLFVATSTNAEGHVTEFYRDFSSGEVATTTNPNGHNFVTIYDGLDRVIEEKVPDPDSPSTLVTSKDISYTDTIGSRKVVETNHLNSATSTDTYTYFDGFDRIIQVRTEMEESGKYAVKDFDYDKREQKEKESFPYEGSGSSKTSITGDTDLLITYTYDTLLRPLTTTNATGTESYAYDQWESVVTDRVGNTKDFTNDAYENLVQVEERDDASTYTTSYEYDVLGNLTKITDALSNVRNFTYDGLSRLTKSEDIHDSADTTFASTTYSYDNSGNITTKLDQNNQTVNYTYDDINRVLTENYTGEAGTEISYEYDWCSNGAGFLCNATTTDAVTKYEYNAHGLKTKETREIDASTYDTSYTFDWVGNQTTLIYPDNSIADYVYNTAGLLDKVLYKGVGDASYSVIVNDYEYHPTGLPYFKQFGNNVESVYTYATTTEFRLEKIETTASTTAMVDEPRKLGLLERALSAAVKVLFAGAKTAHAAEHNFELKPSAPEKGPDGWRRNLRIGADITLDDVSGLEKRGWNYTSAPLSVNLFEQANNHIIASQYQTEFHSKWVNYLSPAGWKGINTDFTLSEDETCFEVTDAPFEVCAPLTSGGTATMLNNNRWDVFKRAEISDGAQVMNIEALGTNDVIGEIVTGTLEGPNGKQENVSYVLYEGAYDNADLIYYIEWGKAPRLEKLVRFPSKPNEYEYSFKYTFEFPVDLRQKEDNGQWNKLERATSTPKKLKIKKDKGFSVQKPSAIVRNSQRGFGFKELKIWDSNQEYATSDEVDRNIELVDYSIEVLDRMSYILTKDVESYFNGNEEIVYPVYTDTTSTFYPDEDTETNTVDGRVGGNGSPWSTLQSASSANQPNDSHTLAIDMANTKASGPYHIFRGVLLFDTSSIDSGDSIDSAELVTYGGSNGNADSVTIGIIQVQGDLASNTAIVAGDYDLVQGDAEDNPTLGGSKLLSTFPTLASEGLATTTLNATGESWIAKSGEQKPSGATAGITFLGTRGSRDYTDNAPTGESSLAYYQAEVSGTTKDPRLVVTHSVSNNAPIAPIDLETEGVTNPTEVLDSTPEFTSIYRDPDIGDTAENYQIEVSTSTEFTTIYWDSTKTAFASSTAEGTRTEEISYSGSDLASSTTYYWRIKMWDDTPAEGSFSTTTASFSLNSAPSEPSTLWTEGSENPIEVEDATPEFSAIYNDPDGSDYADYYQIQVATSTDYWGEPEWDSTKTAFVSSTTQGTRTENIEYAGSELATSTTYYWRIKMWDDADFEGNFSTTTASFTMATTTSASGSSLQSMVYTYDKVGNITHITDTSDTDALKTVLFTYDDIYRLLTASTTAATSNPFSRTYAYSAIGNITTKSDQGSYTYGETGYANPHAATDINGTTLTYDNNGNVTSYGPWDYSWDYRNRLTQADTGSATTTYEYDHENIRIKKTVDGTETLFVNQFYNTTGATTTKHIYAPDGTLLATIEEDGLATTTQYIHTDHLGGTNVITDENGDLVQTLDYYPFGEERINAKVGTFDEQRKFTGLEYDEDSDLHYASSRYYDQDIGRFTSQDPAFLLIGAPEFEQRYQRTLQQHLQNPQALNSYGYALNNPVRYTDPSGEIAPLIGAGAVAVIKASFDVATLALTGIAAYEAKTTIFDYPEQFTSQEKVVSGAKVVTFPGLRLFGSIFGTTQEKAAIDLLTNIAEITDIVSSAPDAVRDTYHSIQNQTRNFFNSGTGSTQTYTTPSGAVVDSGGRLISGPNNDDE